MTCKHIYGNKYCPSCGARLHTKTPPKFPVKTTIYLHSNKDSNWEKGERLGLTEEAIKDNFLYCCYEVPIEVEVYKDGKYKILGVKDL